ncbi:hypothetical protein [Pseudomonas nitroreducens]|uniref:alpha-glutamyl/putrescinyl thymine pyrophosphorylase clade 3 protein n=1 Tax=Pseudomonas nitroreducens TaxID=46680 RepID=UPI000B6EBFF7|nr:hypothetical protein [Pseudomonas nitroreducens]NMZ58614.1 hypothetical protein [Pseudomonas nitroreducens]SNS22157.1 hypothetical protein SAMN05216209_1851 [Pseudomonas nitroreducens]
MKAKDNIVRNHLHNAFNRLLNSGINMPGINTIDNKNALIEQMIESVRRVEFIQAIRQRDISQNRCNPSSPYFDPIRAAIYHQQNGDIEEASWLVFLATHFGKALRSGWLLTSSVYGALGPNPRWTWAKSSFNPIALSDWLSQTHAVLTSGGRRFGNHRKYESLDPKARNWTGEIIESYVNWVLQYGSHQALFDNALNSNNNDPKAAFRSLYHSMDDVKRFGRTAKFDYLTMIGKVHIANIKADSAYLNEATGPLKGARLLFGGTTSSAIAPTTLETLLSEIDQELDVGMQVLEDSLCNWQKSPSIFIQFRG